ncbi:MAG: Rpn family recombination-promoting nuclease/putative transposase [Bacteroidota bacterium]
MSEKKSKKEVHQPDDRLFKVVMRKKEGAAEYLKTHYSELAELLDLETLTIQPEKEYIPDFRSFDSDISYKCQFKNSDQKVNINFIWENKSSPESHVSIQLGLYLFLRYYDMVNNNDKKLEPIIPLIFYNGAEDWIPKRVSELFEDHPFFDFFQSYLPDYNFHFTNIREVPESELLKIEMAFFKSAMIAMANKHNYNLLIQKLSIIFDLDDDDNTISIGKYVFGIYERLPEQVKKDVAQLDYKTKSKIMSTLEMLKEEGRVEGRVKGRVEGKDLVINVVKLLNEGKSVKETATILGIEEKDVLEIKTRLNM